jgi:protein gp37
MADRSAIEWTDATWNPVRARRTVDGVERVGWHCEHVSEGCRNCYAERLNLAGRSRFAGTKLAYKPSHLRTEQRPQGEVEIFLDEKVLLKPLRWRAPRKIFVGSMTDVFADFVTDEMLDRMFAVMALCPQHVFQVLTKRPERMRRYLGGPRAPGRVWAAVDDLVDAWDDGIIEIRQPTIDGNPKLPALAAQGASWGGDQPWPLRNVWLGTSIEDRAALIERAGHLRKTPAAVRFFSCEPLIGDLGDVILSDIDWVIGGGESGPKAREMKAAWIRSLRDQSAAAGVPFFFKQWGEFAPTSDCNGPYMMRVGKKAAGRLLDGVEHNAMPGVPA